MRQDVKETWTKALRSGEYQQGKFRLFEAETESYCCLGVLCDVIETQFENIPIVGLDWRDRRTLEWDLKVKLNMISPDDSATVSYLMELNDSGKTFETIANVIDKEL